MIAASCAARSAPNRPVVDRERLDPRRRGAREAGCLRPVGQHERDRGGEGRAGARPRSAPPHCCRDRSAGLPHGAGKTQAALSDPLQVLSAASTLWFRPARWRRIHAGVGDPGLAAARDGRRDGAGAGAEIGRHAAGHRARSAARRRFLPQQPPPRPDRRTPCLGRADRPRPGDLPAQAAAGDLLARDRRHPFRVHAAPRCAFPERRSVQRRRRGVHADLGAARARHRGAQQLRLDRRRRARGRQPRADRAAAGVSGGARIPGPGAADLSEGVS